MPTAKIIDTKDGQIIKFPKKFKIKEKNFVITRQGDEIILCPKPKVNKKKDRGGRNFARAVEILRSLPDDFMKDEYEEMQRREQIAREKGEQ